MVYPFKIKRNEGMYYNLFVALSVLVNINRI